MRRLGVARSLPLARLGVKAMTRELRTLLMSSDYKIKALETSREIVRERGAQIAATAIERVREAGPLRMR
jgi:UDP:flavonoid glycosyltransferase YjiC (YdhE family)